MTEHTTPPPRLNRPKFHLWQEAADDDHEPTYLGVVTVTNADQLLAETQAKGLGIRPKESPFHLTALWVWAGAIRSMGVDEKFKAFTSAYAWEGIKEPKAEEGEEEPEDPTFGDQEPNTE